MLILDAMPTGNTGGPTSLRELGAPFEKITAEMAANYCTTNHNEYLQKNPDYEGMYNRLTAAIEQVHSSDNGVEQRLSDVEIEISRMKQRVDHLSKLVVE